MGIVACFVQSHGDERGHARTILRRGQGIEPLQLRGCRVRLSASSGRYRVPGGMAAKLIGTGGAVRDQLKRTVLTGRLPSHTRSCGGTPRPGQTISMPWSRNRCLVIQGANRVSRSVKIDGLS